MPAPQTIDGRDRHVRPGASSCDRRGERSEPGSRVPAVRGSDDPAAGRRGPAQRTVVLGLFPLPALPRHALRTAAGSPSASTRSTSRAEAERIDAQFGDAVDAPPPRARPPGDHAGRDRPDRLPACAGRVVTTAALGPDSGILGLAGLLVTAGRAAARPRDPFRPAALPRRPLRTRTLAPDGEESASAPVDRNDAHAEDRPIQDAEAVAGLAAGREEVDRRNDGNHSGDQVHPGLAFRVFHGRSLASERKSRRSRHHPGRPCVSMGRAGHAGGEKSRSLDGKGPFAGGRSAPSVRPDVPGCRSQRRSGHAR